MIVSFYYKNKRYNFEPTQNGLGTLFKECINLVGVIEAGNIHATAKSLITSTTKTTVTMKRTQKQKPWSAHQLQFHQRSQRPNSTPQDWEYARAVNALSGL